MSRYLWKLFLNESHFTLFYKHDNVVVTLGAIVDIELILYNY